MSPFIDIVVFIAKKTFGIARKRISQFHHHKRLATGTPNSWQISEPCYYQPIYRHFLKKSVFFSISGTWYRKFLWTGRQAFLRKLLPHNVFSQMRSLQQCHIRQMCLSLGSNLAPRVFCLLRMQLTFWGRWVSRKRRSSLLQKLLLWRFCTQMCWLLCSHYGKLYFVFGCTMAPKLLRLCHL